MRSGSTARIAPALALVTLAVAGCGSSATKTVSVSGRVGPANTAAHHAAGTATGAGTTANGSSTGATTTPSGSSAPARTATAPAFVEHGSGGGGSGGSGSGSAGGSRGEELAQAVAAVKARGFTPNDTSQYRAGQTLRVLVATRTGSADGYEQQAFFFLDGRYLGTDASAPSAGIEVVGQSDTEVTLGYRLYRPGDPLCCARGGQANVRFQLDNGRLVALDPIPPVDSRTGNSRQ